jgi:hypothetical protein
MVRLPEDRHRELREIAKREGVDLGDYLVRVVLEAHSWPVPAYCYPASAKQGELPIAQAS